MTRRRTTRITWRGKQYGVSFSVAGADPSVGIPSDYSEDHLLLDPETEAELPKAEQDALSDSDWEEIAELVDACLPDLYAYDDETDFYYGFS